MDNLNYLAVDLLKAKNKTCATAESCTGGLIASSIVDVSGSSQVFYEGVVTYSNQSKMARLQVKEDTLKKYGAVSKETAHEMVEGLLKNVDIGVSTTGIAGPSGGTPEKPVGLVYIAVGTKQHIQVEKCNFSGDRQQIRNQAKDKALEMLVNCLQNIN